MTKKIEGALYKHKGSEAFFMMIHDDGTDMPLFECISKKEDQSKNPIRFVEMDDVILVAVHSCIIE